MVLDDMQLFDNKLYVVVVLVCNDSNNMQRVRGEGGTAPIPSLRPLLFIWPWGVASRTCFKQAAEEIQGPRNSCAAAKPQRLLCRCKAPVAPATYCKAPAAEESLECPSSSSESLQGPSGKRLTARPQWLKKN